MNTFFTFRRAFFWLMLGVLLPTSMSGQDYRNLVNSYLERYVEGHDVQLADVQGYTITDQFLSKHNGVTHLHVRQAYQGIEVYNGVANFAIKNGAIVHMADRLESDLAQRANATQPSLTPAQAINAAAQELGMSMPTGLTLQGQKGSYRYFFNTGDISLEDIPVQLMYLPGPEGELSLVWDLSIYPKHAQNWWSVRVDALTGKLLDKLDWVIHCAFPSHPAVPHAHSDASDEIAAFGMRPTQTASNAQYSVFDFKTESPNHGPRSLIIDPSDETASPYGWHDTDGAEGPEYTITRGNNVYATEDRNADNVPGYAPNGGGALNFDFPLNINQQPSAYEDAAITNLFYLNNIMHDIWYHYGFDEASGNFQENNYGKGGIGGDYVNADAQDGGGTNNANFGTPPEGGNPRMQMFLWTGGNGLADLLNVNSPAGISGLYQGAEAGFGPALPATPITEDVVLVDDGTNPNPNDGCTPLINAAQIDGKIAIVERGNCAFVVKVQEAQDAGAVAVIVVNNQPGAPFAMGGASSTITIPSIMISQADGNAIISQLNSGNPVNATLQSQGGNFDRDGDFDNGIIAHEYGHGISIRLTGGPATSGCLSGGEQMGEGWSDYFALFMTLDTNVVSRGIGTFAVDQPITGQGIRPAPYSPDFNVNPFTYAATNNTANISQPHGVGFVWCTMLWDLTLELVDVYGFDPDFYEGTGGNNMALQLVMDGLKLQPCGPGFVDGRDAILLADQLNYGGANECLIWEVFARRGLGYSASQGSSASRTDQVEAFDLPPKCLTPTAAPSAAFIYTIQSVCNDRAVFTDLSSSTPQDWRWDFGDGSIDSVQNPSHVYTSSGVYTVTLIVTNTLGADTVTQQVLISLPQGPIVLDQEICSGDLALLSVIGPNRYTWYDGQGNQVDTGAFFVTGNLFNDTVIFVDQAIPGIQSNIGPTNGSIGAGGYHNTGFTGALNFTADDKLTIVSAWIDAGSAGSRTISLWNGFNGGGTPIASVTVNATQGPQRITLNLEVPGPGDYSIGGASIDLFRNQTGANYPYVIPNLLSIVSSSATTSPADFYYYLYDWEVEGPSCKSDLVPVTVQVDNAEFEFVEDTTTRIVQFTDLSTNATSWDWSFGDGATSNQQNPLHAYTSAGIYPVELRINSLCVYRDTVVLPVLSNTDAPIAFGVSVTPNPAQDQVWVNLNQAVQEDLDLTLYSLEGKAIRNAQLRAGETAKSFDLKGIAPGVYMIQARGEALKQTIRLIVNP
ncbi:MAG: T9SS-dependent M36 family metallopeptidase [Bacteroidota bacterium]